MRKGLRVHWLVLALCAALAVPLAEGKDHGGKGKGKGKGQAQAGDAGAGERGGKGGKGRGGKGRRDDQAQNRGPDDELAAPDEAEILTEEMRGDSAALSEAELDQLFTELESDRGDASGAEGQPASTGSTGNPSSEQQNDPLSYAWPKPEAEDKQPVGDAAGRAADPDTSPGQGKHEAGSTAGAGQGGKQGWSEGRPRGWGRGQKKGWGGAGLPPGLARRGNKADKAGSKGKKDKTEPGRGEARDCPDAAHRPDTAAHERTHGARPPGSETPRRPHQPIDRQVLSMMGTNAVPGLVAALQNQDPEVRWRAADALGEFEAATELAVPALREALEDPDEDVRQAASAALERLTTGEAGGL